MSLVIRELKSVSGILPRKVVQINPKKGANTKIEYRVERIWNSSSSNFSNTETVKRAGDMQT